MSTPTTPTSPSTALPDSPQRDKPANALTVTLSLLSAVWQFFTAVYCEFLQITLLVTLALVMGNLFWHSALLAVIVIMSAIGILYTGYRKLHNTTGRAAEKNKSPPSGNESSPWIKLTGNRLLNIALIWAFGIFKLVDWFKKQTLDITIVDFISGVVIGSTMKLIDWFGDDHPEALNWFYRRDYNQSVLMALNTLWIICAYVLAALLLLPLGIIDMPDSNTYAIQASSIQELEDADAVIRAYVTAYVTADASVSILIEAILITVLVCMMSFRVWLNMHPIRLSQWPTTGLKLVEQLRIIIFFWGVLWMTSLIWIRSNPEVEYHFVGIYIISYDPFATTSATMLSLCLPLFLLLGYISDL